MRGKGVEAKWKKVLGVSMAIGRSAEFLVILCCFGLFWRKVLGVSMAIGRFNIPFILGNSGLFLVIFGYFGLFWVHFRLF